MNTPQLSTRLTTARKIENHMAAKAIKRKELTAALGVTYQTFKRRMSGELPFTVDEIWTIARILRAKPSEILPDDITEDAAVAA